MSKNFILNLANKSIPILFFFLGACAYNAKVVPSDPCAQFQGATCDTTVKYTYNGQIKTFMETNCGTTTGCHDVNNGDSPKLNTQGDLIAYVTDCNKRAKLEASIHHTGGKPMPEGSDKMPQEDINKLLNWICQGAKP